MRRGGWAGCFNCKGKKGCPRASKNSVRCTASACTKKLTEVRKAKEQEQPEVAVSQQALEDSEDLPEGLWVHELTEILGERCCRPAKLSNKRRRVGPRDTSRSTSSAVCSLRTTAMKERPTRKKWQSPTRTG